MDNQRKIVMVTRRTRFEALVAQYNTESQAAFVIESRGQDFHDYKIEHQVYYQAIKDIQKSLAKVLRVQLLEREFLPNFQFGRDDIIMVVGQDGLVANTLKYLDGQPVIAVNPDPARFDGVLLPYAARDVRRVVEDVINQRLDVREITMAQASLNNGQTLTAVNDLFVGPRFQISARYELDFDGHREMQSSSGLIVSTGLGSTGWLTSVRRGAEGILGSRQHHDQSFAWESRQLRFVVREPFPSQVTGTELVYGEINETTPLAINSMMAQHGVIFSDGMIDDYIEFNSGTAVKIGVSDSRGKLVIG